MAVNKGLKSESFVNGIRKNGYIVKNNKFYNRTSSGGYSGCIAGSPVRSGADVLCNCVGLANGAFNETYVKCKQLVNSNFTAKQYYGFVRNGNKTIETAQSLGLTTIAASGVPPVGGLIAWGGGANHVAYIAEVIDNNTITIIQSGYNTPSWTELSTDGTGWCCDTRTISRGSNNLWPYQNTCPSGTVCLGFVVNPGVAEVPDNPNPPTPPEPEPEPEPEVTKYGVHIGGKFYSAHIYNGTKWVKATPKIYNGTKWIDCSE